MDGLYTVIAQKQNGFLVIQNSWCIITIALFYSFFYISFKIFKRHKRAITFIILLTILYCIVGKVIGLGAWWYCSSMAFPLGLIIQEREEQVFSIIKKHNIACFIGLLVLFLCAYAGRFINSRLIHSELLYTVICLFASAVFALMVVVILQRITIENRIWSFVGSISMELYLSHELVYTALRNRYCYITSDLLYITVTLTISLVLAWLLHLCINKVLALLKIR